MIKRHNASAVLIEDTNQGSALVSEIRPRPGMRVCPIIPIGDKIERVRKHQAIIRSGGIQLPSDAVWRESFIAEWSLFPCAGFDDQVDATVQYLEWISNNRRPAQAGAVWGHRHDQFARTADIWSGHSCRCVKCKASPCWQASRRPWYW